MDWKAHPSVMYIHILFWRIYFYKSDFSFSFYGYFFIEFEIRRFIILHE